MEKLFAGSMLFFLLLLSMGLSGCNVLGNKPQVDDGFCLGNCTVADVTAGTETAADITLESTPTPIPEATPTSAPEAAPDDIILSLGNITTSSMVSSFIVEVSFTGDSDGDATVALKSCNTSSGTCLPTEFESISSISMNRGSSIYSVEVPFGVPDYYLGDEIMIKIYPTDPDNMDGYSAVTVTFSLCDTGMQDWDSSVSTREAGIFLISSANQLVSLAANCVDSTHYASCDESFKLCTDIDMSSTSFIPIGSPNWPFTGTFDGNGKKIMNLEINLPNREYVGLFGLLKGEVSFLTIENSNVHGSAQVGIVAGAIQGAIVGPEVNVSGGNVLGQQHVGGLVGHMSNDSAILSQVSYVETSADVSSNLGYAGGAIGCIETNAGGTIHNILSNGDVFGGGVYLGGLVGYGKDVGVESSYANGNILGAAASHVGGFIGISDNGTNIRNSVATGAVSGNDYVGGFVGYNNTFGTISTSTASGNVTAEFTINAGAFVGYNSGTINP
ncbi:MAG: hypothetical protein A2504_12700 [Bdellovibrionales bacterium RIFOXYD12_FULL_39_22]|nr:MAG: hypothetical protein A2385_03785 [Bdellovibrionales bacterium RIFOXYB1_FULL_39_21]OFZ40473.1 MAG: hypothetical protein A2485_02650 [Bdellovibrionales bacterium RIFOXYC12_FULL_39_17]OFZ49956.1 MAG: hypothetical protein A2404_01985 [Bdellovibrionales bacterium RIFOXYC1_FULL_39_130]OFZ77598.1 MAG: hypothetical protein A2560_04545 [Bdellovibrionales bacterium RIFOXYD1_FULL_39_84]OFZ96052.1 MAG: hypothetical protein A2504_12700 [Bdellovibrionales bacterium RIFOXYD12_FULL_39_22]HLE10659.1 GL